MTVYNHYEIQTEANIPENLPLDQVANLVEHAISLGEEVNLLTLKPGSSGLSTEGVGISNILECSVGLLNLRILCLCVKNLTGDEVTSLYAKIFADHQSNTPGWLVDLRAELLNYMTSEYVCSYLISGPDALTKTIILRDFLRNIYLEGANQTVKNLFHSPDLDEFASHLTILFTNNDI